MTDNPPFATEYREVERPYFFMIFYDSILVGVLLPHANTKLIFLISVSSSSRHSNFGPKRSTFRILDRIPNNYRVVIFFIFAQGFRDLLVNACENKVAFQNPEGQICQYIIFRGKPTIHSRVLSH